MSDSENVFEQPEAEAVTVEIEPEAAAEGVEEPEPEEPPKKAKKPRKPMSEERKQQLRENLKKGRETSLANRRAKAKKKGTFKKAISLEDQEKEEQALEIAQAKIAAAEARKEQREAAKHARAEASEAKELAKQLRVELDELKAERAESKKRKAAIKAEQAAKQKELDEKTAAAQASAEQAVPPPTPVLSGRALSRLMRGL